MTGTDLTLSTLMGPVHGCRGFEGSVDLAGSTFAGEAWYHPTLGLIAAHVDWPPPDGVNVDLVGITDFGAAADGYGFIQKAGVLGPATSSFRLDTYDVHQAFDADKDTHAKMVVELRWVDEEKARETTPPSIAPEFGTAFGYYPSSLEASPLSFFYPDENGSGYTFWIGFVDQAAKNEAENGIAYHVAVQDDGSSGAGLRVTARILYKLYEP